MKVTFIFTFIFLLSSPSFALDLFGNHSDALGTYTHGSAEWKQHMNSLDLQSLYLFDDVVNGNVIQDVSGVNNYDLEIYNTGTVLLRQPANTMETEFNIPPGSILNFEGTPRTKKYFQVETLENRITSQTSIANIANKCNASKEFTIELWVSNEVDMKKAMTEVDLDRRVRKPARIFTISRQNPLANIESLKLDQLSSAQSSIFVGQEYDGQSSYRFNYKTQGQVPFNPIEDETENFLPSKADIGLGQLGNNHLEVGGIQHIVFTRNSNGTTRVFLSKSDDSGNPVDSLVTEIAGNNDFQGNLIFDPTHKLAFANELDFGTTAPNSRLASERRGWTGKLYMAAIYCKSLTKEQVLGNRAPGFNRYVRFSLDSNAIITDSQKKAALIYQRLVGVKTPISNPIIGEMASQIDQGNLGTAAAIATDQSDFFNITVRDFAAKMSTRDETVNSPLSDFTAMFIGVTRDNKDARTLLTGNFSYKADTNKAAVPNNTKDDHILSNNHYDKLEEGNFNLVEVLKYDTPQKDVNGSGAVINRESSDAAGVITSRAFLGAHADAGTNRRLVEYTLRQFLCISIDKAADSDGPDRFIGRDIDRFPASDHTKFTTSCRACHTVLDSFRGAFSAFTFENNFVKNANILPNGIPNDNNPFQTEQNPNRVVKKMNHNQTVFPGGFELGSKGYQPDYWENNANRRANSAFFQWNGPENGTGVNSFARLIASSKAFPSCMAKRVYRSVCKRDPVIYDQSTIDKAASNFVINDYNMKKLFQEIAVSEACIGK